MRCHAFHQESCDSFIIQVIRQVQQFVRRIIANFGITSKWRNAVSYAVTRFEVVYASANTLHGTNAFKAYNDIRVGSHPQRGRRLGRPARDSSRG